MNLRRVGQLIGLYVLVQSVLVATGITACTLDNASLNLNECYNANTFFTTPLTLDWGTAFGPASLINGTNPADLTKGALTTNIAGINVSVTVGSDFMVIPQAGDMTPASARFLARTDNEVFQYLNGGWTVSPTQFTYGGHFYGPGDVNGTPQLGGGARLLEMYNNNGVFGTGSYVITFDRPVAAAGLLVSVQGNGSNTDFDATIKAFNSTGNPFDVAATPMSAYTITTNGLGGVCDSLNHPPPTACNDAPFIGIRALGSLTSQQISSIVISANTGLTPDSVLIDSLQLEAFAPEPSVAFLCGAGLLLIGVMRRKQRVARSRR